MRKFILLAVFVCLLIVLGASKPALAFPITIGGVLYDQTGVSETVTAVFDQADGGVSVGTYSGFVELTVSESGYSQGTCLNDAFYLYNCPQTPAHNAQHHQLVFDTQVLVPFNPSRCVKHFIIYDIDADTEVMAPPYVPAYRFDHIYNFVIDLGTTVPNNLHFGVSDGNFYDNSGAYTIEVTQLQVIPEPSPPTANAGPDQVLLDSDDVTLDGSQSDDPDGTIVSYEWLLQHQENSDNDRDATGVSPTVSDLEPGFYVVALTVTDDTDGEGLTDTDTMLLAVGPCAGWPQPNAGLITKQLEIKEGKNEVNLKVNGTINLPELGVSDGDIVESRTTIEIFGALPDGGDLVISSEDTLKVNYKKYLEIKK